MIFLCILILHFLVIFLNDICTVVTHCLLGLFFKSELVFHCFYILQSNNFNVVKKKKKEGLHVTETGQLSPCTELLIKNYN